jgi:hypothetical protein
MRQVFKAPLYLGGFLLSYSLVAIMLAWFEWLPDSIQPYFQEVESLNCGTFTLGFVVFLMGLYGMISNPLVRDNVVVIRFTDSGFFVSQLHESTETFHRHGPENVGLLYIDDLESFAKAIWSAIDENAKPQQSFKKSRPYVLGVINHDFPTILKVTLRDMIERSGYECFFWGESGFSRKVAMEYFSNPQTMKSVLT